MHRCRLDILTPTDLSAVFRLHRGIYASLRDKSVLYLRDEAFFHQLLAGKGWVIGARVGSRLIGYAALKRAGRDDLQVYEPGFWLPAEDEGKVAEAAGSAIHPDFCGRGLHRRLLNTRRALARRDGFRHLTGIVSINNPLSTASCVRCGFQVYAMHFDADGPNLLLHDRLSRRPVSVERFVACWVELANINGHRAALDAGCRGIRYHWSANALMVGYGPAAEVNPA